MLVYWLIVIGIILEEIPLVSGAIKLQCPCEDYLPCQAKMRPRNFGTCVRTCKRYPEVVAEEIPPEYEKCILEFDDPITRMINCSSERVLNGCGSSEVINVVTGHSQTGFYNLTIETLKRITMRVGVDFQFKTDGLHNYHRCLFGCLYPAENKCTRKLSCGLLMPDNEAFLDELRVCAGEMDVTHGIILEIANCLRQVVHTVDPITPIISEERETREEPVESGKSIGDDENEQKKRMEYLWRHWGEEERQEIKKEQEKADKRRHELARKISKQQGNKGEDDENQDSDQEDEEKEGISGKSDPIQGALQLRNQKDGDTMREQKEEIDSEEEEEEEDESVEEGSGERAEESLQNEGNLETHKDMGKKKMLNRNSLSNEKAMDKMKKKTKEVKMETDENPYENHGNTRVNEENQGMVKKKHDKNVDIECIGKEKSKTTVRPRMTRKNIPKRDGKQPDEMVKPMLKKEMRKSTTQTTRIQQKVKTKNLNMEKGTGHEIVNEKPSNRGDRMGKSRKTLKMDGLTSSEEYYDQNLDYWH